MRYVQLHSGKKLGFDPETSDDVIVNTVRRMLVEEQEKEAKPQRDQQQVMAASLQPLIDAINLLTQTVNQRSMELMQVLAMPKRVIRDSDGRLAGAEIAPPMTIQ